MSNQDVAGYTNLKVMVEVTLFLGHKLLESHQPAFQLVQRIDQLQLMFREPVK